MPRASTSAQRLLSRVAMAAVASSSSVASTRAAHLLITDFDGTCTITDTTPLIPHLAARAAATPNAAEKILSTFKELEDLYLSRLSSCKAALQADEQGTSLETALAQMDAVSNDIISKLSDSGILAGIRDADVAPAVLDWRDNPTSAPVVAPALRDGCVDALNAAVAEGWELGILSICWCPSVIRAYLPLLGERHGVGGDVPRLWSNRIDESSGAIANDVDGAAAKRRIIDSLKRDDAVGEGEGEAARRVVYIGDSTTDLLAMLAADVGILIGESRSARDVARQYGVRILPLASVVSDEPEGALAALCAAEEKTIWEAASWADVRRCLQL